MSGIIDKVEPRKIAPKKLGIVLSGGGIKAVCSAAATFIVLEEFGIKPYAVCGTSGGAIGAAMYCAGLTGQQMRGHLSHLKVSDYFDPSYLGVARGILSGFRGWTGLAKGNAIKRYLRSILPTHYFNSCTTRCFVVTVNISKGQKEILENGNLVDAASASAAIPFVYQAVRIGNDYFMDGGAISNVPAYSLSCKIPTLDHIIVSSTQDLDPYEPEDHVDIKDKAFTPYFILRRWLDAVLREERDVHLNTGIIPNTLMRVRMDNVDFFHPEEADEAIQSAVSYIRDFLKTNWKLGDYTHGSN